MTKYCVRCGAPNVDEARFCVTCGNPFPQQPGTPQTAQPGPQPAGYQQKSRAERAFSLFAKNLGLVLPMVLLLIAYLVVAAILVLAVFAAVFGSRATGGVFSTPILVAGGLSAAAAVILFAFWVLTGIFVSIVAVEARSVALSQAYTLSQAWAEVRSRLGDVVLVAVVLGVVGALLGLIPFIGWLLEAIVFSYFVLVEALMFTQNLSASAALGGALSWGGLLIDRDPLSAVVLLVAAILSEIPLINLFAVPYAVLLATIFLLDSGAGAPAPPPAAPTPVA